VGHFRCTAAGETARPTWLHQRGVSRVPLRRSKTRLTPRVAESEPYRSTERPIEVDISTVDEYVLARDVAGSRRHQEQHCVGNFFGVVSRFPSGTRETMPDSFASGSGNALSHACNGES